MFAWTASRTGVQLPSPPALGQIALGNPDWQHVWRYLRRRWKTERFCFCRMNPNCNPETRGSVAAPCACDAVTLESEFAVDCPLVVRPLSASSNTIASLMKMDRDWMRNFTEWKSTSQPDDGRL